MSTVPVRKRHAGRGPAGATEPGALGRAERVGDLLPRIAPRECLRQVQGDAPDRALDPPGDLEQALAQGPDLGGADRRGARMGLQHLAQDIGRRGEQQTELVGREARATRAIHGHPVLQFFEPILQSPRPQYSRV